MKLSSEEEVRLLDRILDGNWQALIDAKPEDTEMGQLIKLFLELKGKTSGFLENLKAMPQLPVNLKKALTNFAEIAELLDALDCRYEIDITSTRGFEYYTGLCFQLSVKGKKIGSGGRYDNLIPLIGGKKTPACGFALYLEPLSDLIQSKARQTTVPDILVRCDTKAQDAIRASFELAAELRKAGYVTGLDFDGRQTGGRWLVTVPEKPMTFTVIDSSRNRKAEASTMADVVKMVGGSA
jgi:histidyl-tRNA synthetase